MPQWTDSTKNWRWIVVCLKEVNFYNSACLIKEVLVRFALYISLPLGGVANCVPLPCSNKRSKCNPPASLTAKRLALKEPCLHLRSFWSFFHFFLDRIRVYLQCGNQKGAGQCVCLSCNVIPRFADPESIILGWFSGSAGVTLPRESFEKDSHKDIYTNINESTTK